MKERLIKKRGITLMMLAITIIILVILASTIIISSNTILNDTLKKDFGKEIYSIQKLVENYYHLNDEYPILEEYVLDLADIEEEYRFEFQKENITNNMITLYIIDLEKCDVSEIKRGNRKNKKDIYVLSKDTGIVYYIDGVNFENMKYYTLTEDLKNEIGL